MAMRRARIRRLTRVDEESGTRSRPLKIFHFETANDGADLRKGKLGWAERYNYVTLNDNPITVRMRETYEYAGVGGAVSRRDTRHWVDEIPAESFTQGFGLLGAIEVGVSSGAAPLRVYLRVGC